MLVINAVVKGGSVISTAPCSALTHCFYRLFLLIPFTWLASLCLSECTLQKLAGRVYGFLLALSAKNSRAQKYFSLHGTGDSFPE